MIECEGAQERGSVACKIDLGFEKPAKREESRAKVRQWRSFVRRYCCISGPATRRRSSYLNTMMGLIVAPESMSLTASSNLSIESAGTVSEQVAQREEPTCRS